MFKSRSVSNSYSIAGSSEKCLYTLPAASPCLSITALLTVLGGYSGARGVIRGFPTGEILCTLGSFLLVDWPVAEQMSILTVARGSNNRSGLA